MAGVTYACGYALNDGAEVAYACGYASDEYKGYPLTTHNRIFTKSG
jgi:hypothetical protein